jgi:hypothetical protein
MEMTTTTVRHVGRIQTGEGGIDVLEAGAARLIPVHWVRDAEAGPPPEFQWLSAIYSVQDTTHPGSLPAVIQWRKHGPRSGAWFCGEFMFRTMTRAARQALAIIAAREGRYAD